MPILHRIYLSTKKPCCQLLSSKIHTLFRYSCPKQEKTYKKYENPIAKTEVSVYNRHTYGQKQMMKGTFTNEEYRKNNGQDRSALQKPRYRLSRQ